MSIMSSNSPINEVLNSSSSSFLVMGRTKSFQDTFSRSMTRKGLNDLDEAGQRAKKINSDKSEGHTHAYSWSMFWFDTSHQHFMFHGHANPDEMVIFECPSGYNSFPDNIQKYSLSDVHIPNKSAILLCKLSLDGEILAIQQSLTNIIVLDLDSRRQWSITIKASNDADRTNRILTDGVIWSDHGGNSQDLILVTLKGLELYKISSSRVQCKLSRTVPMNCYAFWHEPNHRMMLVASARLSTTPTPKSENSPAKSPTKSNTLLQMTGIFFRTDKTDQLVKLELPPPEKSPSFDIGPGVSKENIAVVSLYGQPYCVVLQRILGSDYLLLHHITKHNVTLSHVLSIPCENYVLKLSVIDNILVCHCHLIQKSVLYDIKISTSSSVKRLKNPYNDDEIDVLAPIGPPSDMVLEEIAPGNQLSPEESYDDSTSLIDDDNVEYRRHVVTDITFIAPSNISGRHGTSLKWQVCSPAWIWNSDNQTVSRIRLDIRAIAEYIHDPKLVVSFLIRRSQIFDAPRPVYQTIYDEDQANEAKNLLFERLNGSLENMIGLSWLEAIFKILIAPYAQVYNHDNSLIQAHASTSSPIKASENTSNAVDETSSEAPISQKNISQTKRTSVRIAPVSLAAQLASFGFGVVSGQLLTGLPSTATPSSANSSSKAQSDRLNSYNKRPMSPIDRKSVIVSSDKRNELEPLDISSSLQLLLPDITAVSARSRTNMKNDRSYASLDGKKKHVSYRHLTSANSLSPVFSVAIRRNLLGDLVISQIETLCFIWLPLTHKCEPFISLSESSKMLSKNGDSLMDNLISKQSPTNTIPSKSSTSNLSNDSRKVKHIPIDYYSWSLSTYISCLRSEGIAPHPALSLLLLHVLSSQRKYLQISKLVFHQLLPDCVEIAMAGLELADIITDTELADKGRKINSNKESSPTKTSKQDIQSIALKQMKPYDLIAISSAIKCLQQVGLDMLWRLDEKALTVRWMLGHGKLMEAITLCRRKRDMTGVNLSANDIPAMEFFTATVSKLQTINMAVKFMTERSEERDDREIMKYDGEKVEIMQTVYNFLKEWDATSMVIASTGKSKIASQCQFPSNTFDVFHAARFKELFGFTAAPSI